MDEYNTLNNENNNDILSRDDYILEMFGSEEAANNATDDDLLTVINLYETDYLPKVQQYTEAPIEEPEEPEEEISYLSNIARGTGESAADIGGWLLTGAANLLHNDNQKTKPIGRLGQRRW